MPAPVIRFALLGCGRMGLHHGRLLARDPRATIQAVFDPVTAAAETLCQELAPAATRCASLEALLDRDDVDAVVIATPTGDHFLHASRCLDRGWHILCEKPLATRREDLLELISRAARTRQSGTAFSVAYQRRHWATFRTLRNEVRSGRWGAVRAVAAHNVEDWQSSIPGTWRDDPLQNPGGFVADAGSHKLDTLFYVTGLKPLEVFARSQNWGSRVEIVTSVSALLERDVIATFDFVGHARHLGEDLHIHCEQADLILRQDRLWIARDNRLEPFEVTAPQSEPVPDFLDSVCNGAEELAPPECALPVWETTQAILSSSRSQTVVRIPSLQ